MSDATNSNSTATYKIDAKTPNIDFLIQWFVQIFLRRSPLHKKREILCEGQPKRKTVYTTYITMAMSVPVFAVFPVFLVVKHKFSAIKIAQFETSVICHHELWQLNVICETRVC